MSTKTQPTNTELQHRVAALALAAADLDMQTADMPTKANVDAWKAARRTLQQLSTRLVIERRTYTRPTVRPTYNARPAATTLHTNRRTPGLTCDRCSIHLPIGSRYRLASTPEGPAPFCISCARPATPTPTPNFRRWNADQYLACLIDNTPATRTGPLADAQTSWDDLQESSVTAIRTLKVLARTLHEPHTFETRTTWTDLDENGLKTRHSRTVQATTTHSEHNAEPIDEIEQERTPEIPDWTDVRPIGPRITETSRHPWRIVTLPPQGVTADVLAR